jgi:hypothetical protein
VDWYWPHSLVNRFHTEWQKLPSRGLRDTYDQCLRSDISQRWWKRDRVDAKEIMLHLIDADPELAAIAWKDLAQPRRLWMEGYPALIIIANNSWIFIAYKT